MLVYVVLCNLYTLNTSAVYELVEQELLKWKQRYQKISSDSRPNSCSYAMKDCGAKAFPNISVLLRIACTLPVTSCTCKRSASVIRRLHTWTRATMGQNILSSLALIHIHRDMPVDLDEVVNIFITKHPRRLELGNVLAY